MRETLLVLLAVAGLCGCASSREVHTSHGTVVYAISCQLQSYESCVEKAGEICGTVGYRFVSADGSPAPAPMPPAAPATPADSPSAGYAWSRKFYVSCHS